MHLPQVDQPVVYWWAKVYLCLYWACVAAPEILDLCLVQRVGHDTPFTRLVCPFSGSIFQAPTPPDFPPHFFVAIHSFTVDVSAVLGSTTYACLIFSLYLCN